MATAARRSARLRRCCRGDILVIAGKRHEQGQTVATVHPFDDGRRRAPWSLCMVEPLLTSDEVCRATGGNPRASFAATGVPSTPVRSRRATCSSPWAGCATATSLSSRPSRARPASWPPSRSPRRRMVGDTFAALEKLASPPARAPQVRRRGHRLGRQDQRHPGDHGGLDARRPGAFVGEVLTTIGVPLTSLHAARYGARGVEIA